MPNKRSKRKKFKYNINRKRLWKKSKKVPEIQCAQIKEAWDKRKSVKDNLADMGLAVDPNTAIPIPKSVGPFRAESMELDAMSKKPSKTHVVEELEVEASIPGKKTLRLSRPEISFCTYMMETYGEDYKAMARDDKNYYQDTPKQIRNRIKAFKNVPDQYKKYLEEKKSGTGTSAMDTS